MTQVLEAFTARVLFAVHACASSTRSSVIVPTHKEEPKGENTQ
jgi:hypothetical protein